MKGNNCDPTEIENVIGWWRALHPDPENPRGNPGNRGARARLRRCASVLDALLEPETHALIALVYRSSRRIDDRLAILAVTLAQIRPTPRGVSLPRFAEALGFTAKGQRSTDESRPRLSRTRFGALLRASRNPDDFARALRRAITILREAQFDVYAFIRDILAFDDKIGRDWTFEYYGTKRKLTPVTPHDKALTRTENKL